MTKINAKHVLENFISLEEWPKYIYNERKQVIRADYEDNGWEEFDYDKNGNCVYKKNSTGFWEKREYVILDEAKNIVRPSNHSDSNNLIGKWKYEKIESSLSDEDHVRWIMSYADNQGLVYEKKLNIDGHALSYEDNKETWWNKAYENGLVLSYRDSQGNWATFEEHEGARYQVECQKGLYYVDKKQWALPGDAENIRKEVRDAFDKKEKDRKKDEARVEEVIKRMDAENKTRKKSKSKRK